MIGTHINVMELVGDEGRSATIAAAVASAAVFVVTAESLILLALRAGPAELRNDIH
jgi:hypothetical protein